MKQCKYCRQPVDDKAKICPHCRKQIKTDWKGMLIAAPIVMIALMSCTCCVLPKLFFNNDSETSNGNSTIVETPKDNNEEVKSGSQIIIESGEYGKYGERIVLGAKTEFPDTRFVYKLPAGDYKVENGSDETIASIAIVKDKLVPYEDNPEIDTFERVGDKITYSLATEDFDMNGQAKKSYILSLAEDEKFLIYNGSKIKFTALSGQTLEESRTVSLKPDEIQSSIESAVEMYFALLYENNMEECPQYSVKYLENEKNVVISFVIYGTEQFYTSAQNGDRTEWTKLEDFLLSNNNQLSKIINGTHGLDVHVICMLLSDANADNVLIGVKDGYINYNAV